MYKRSVIAAMMVLVTAFFWAVAGDWVQDPLRLSDWWHMAAPGILLILSGAVVGLGFALMDRSLERWYAIAGIAVMFPVVFGLTNGIAWFGAAAIFATLWWGDRSITRHLRDRRTIRMHTIVAGGMTWVLVAFYLGASFAYYQTPLNQRTASVSGVEAYVRQSAEKTYGGMLQSELAQLPSTERQRVTQQATEQVAAWVGNYLGPFAKYLPPLLAFAFFLALIGLNFVFSELAIWTALGLFMLLRALRFVRIEQQNVPADVLVL